MKPVREKLKALTDKQLIELSKELRQTTVPQNALIREVIKDSDMDTTAPILAFVGVGALLQIELADRFEQLIHLQ